MTGRDDTHLYRSYNDSEMTLMKMGEGAFVT